MSQTDADVLALREKLLNDMYAAGGSMLESMGKKKRKLGTKDEEEQGEENSFDLGNLLSGGETDPLEAADAEVTTIMNDQDAVLSADPVISRISGPAMSKTPKPGGGSSWRKRIYDTARESLASQRKPRSTTGNDVGAIATGLWNQAKGASGGG